MKVAIDARKLLDGGIGTYIRQLLEAYAQGPDDVVALLDPAQRADWPPRGAVRVAPVRAGKYGLFEHVRVPAAARAAGADVLHEPHYTLPLLWTGPAVVTVFDLTHLRFPHFHPPGASLYARTVAGMAVRRAQVVITASEDARRDVVEMLGARPERMRVIPLGVSPEFTPWPAEELEAFRTRHRLPRGYVLYVGARKRHKNLELLLDAWATMPDNARPPLVVAGPAWPGDHPLARRARARGVEHAIHFAPGITSDHDLAGLYGAAALYVQPSLAEGFGLPPLEALACGTPVLSSDAGSLPEVLGDAARLLPPHQPAAWAAAVQELLADDAGRAERIARGRAHAARFTWARTAALTRQTYADALAMARSRQPRQPGP